MITLRYFDGFSDVFVEDDHLLYVEDQPFDFAYMRACREYREIDGEWWAGDHAGASPEYLATLELASEECAREICQIEYANVFAAEYANEIL